MKTRRRPGTHRSTDAARGALRDSLLTRPPGEGASNTNGPATSVSYVTQARAEVGTRLTGRRARPPLENPPRADLG
jgi:hypothetical protein